MNYVGNFKSWITDKLIHHLQTHSGDLRNVWQPERWHGHPELNKYRELARPGYGNGRSIFHQFNKLSPDMQGFEIVLPELPTIRKHVFWWFVKLNPGEIQAMHIDPHLVEVVNPVRYTMYLQDYIPGHIFLYEDFLSANYKMGDVYEWSDPMLAHGCANISFEPRYTLQITMHD